MSYLNYYCDELVAEVSDYRSDSMTIDRTHVLRWANQFAPNEREFVVYQTKELMKHWYASKKLMQELPTAIATSQSICGGKNPAEFWRSANVLALQEHGSSQAEVLTVFDQVLSEKYGFRLAECGSSDGPFVYVDDCVFSGTQVRDDLRRWIENEDVCDAKIVIVTLGCHRGAIWHITSKLKDLLKPRRNSLQFFNAQQIENQKHLRDESEVLWPAETYPLDPLIDEFVGMLKEKGYPPEWRSTSARLPKGFASEEKRTAYETIMLRKGIELRQLCKSPADSMKPLGFTRLWTFGFGGLFTTYRNCANNAPLAWWWGDPEAHDGPLSQWYPLLPRKRPEGSIQIFRGLGLR